MSMADLKSDKVQGGYDHETATNIVGTKQIRY